MRRKALALALLVGLVALFPITAAHAMGKLVTTQEKMIVTHYYDDTYYGYVFAELTNSGDKPVEYANGLLEFFDPDGNGLGTSSLYYCYPPVLQPGESGYLFGSSYLEAPDQEHISDFMLSVTGQGTISKEIDLLEAVARHEVVEDSYSTNDYFVAIINNSLDEPINSFDIVFAAKDADGALIAIVASYWSGYDVALMPDSKMEMRYAVDSYIADYMRENQIVPATVEAIVYRVR